MFSTLPVIINDFLYVISLTYWSTSYITNILSMYHSLYTFPEFFHKTFDSCWKIMISIINFSIQNLRIIQLIDIKCIMNRLVLFSWMPKINTFKSLHSFKVYTIDIKCIMNRLVLSSWMPKIYTFKSLHSFKVYTH